mmetsp:Transcript_44363/g.117686  ORF Transcript_44363/g.117686 Transcript_44363/m.117686 type:complete len:263 (-) Transcript_44363:281-1069(-)|eukprot:CAMPEP_0194537110 /NCGR_PEP_ID=MMETSP0253-20130528/76267_1 /TAXON_ID=2966 /ORGANISM="Noctiluca scintillans" /LENGTH=262 /DNA_ID=CAMNT_0039383097 /DNA_START=131 /DNA_END=919 /DNA_ORIENTATION=-
MVTSLAVEDGLEPWSGELSEPCLSVARCPVLNLVLADDPWILFTQRFEDESLGRVGRWRHLLVTSTEARANGTLSCGLGLFQKPPVGALHVKAMTTQENDHGGRRLALHGVHAVRTKRQIVVHVHEFLMDPPQFLVARMKICQVSPTGRHVVDPARHEYRQRHKQAQDDDAEYHQCCFPSDLRSICVESNQPQTQIGNNCGDDLIWLRPLKAPDVLREQFFNSGICDKCHQFVSCGVDSNETILAGTVEDAPVCSKPDSCRT